MLAVVLQTCSLAFSKLRFGNLAELVGIEVIRGFSSAQRADEILLYLLRNVWHSVVRLFGVLNTTFSD